MKQLTENQEKEILSRTGANKINLVRRTLLKSEIIDSHFIHEIDDFIFTDVYEERYMNVGLDFSIGKEQTRKAVNVTTK